MKKILTLLAITMTIVAPTATVIACGGTDTIAITPRIQLDLSNLITKPNLGLFTMNVSDEAILKKVKELNPDLDLDQVFVTNNNNNGQATIKVKTDAENYSQGEVKVFYTNPTNPKFSLESVIQNTNLGPYDALPTQEQVLERVRILNPSLDLTQIDLTDHVNNEVSLQVKTDSKIYLQGSIKLQYTIDKRVDLETVLTNSDLGEMNGLPNVGEILTKLKALNPNLNLNEIQLMSFENAENKGQALLSVRNFSQVYKPGSINLTYSYDLRVKLSDIVTTKNLDWFNDVPTNEQILERIKEYNPDLDLTQINITNRTAGTVTIAVIENSTIYHGESLTLTYLPNLVEVIKNLNLGSFDDQPTNEQFLARVKQLNPEVEINQLEIRFNSRGTVIIGVIPNSTLYASSTVTMTYLSSLKEIIRSSNLDSFEKIPTNEQLLERIKEYNPDLDVSQISITTNESGKVTIKVIDNSTLYSQGTFELTYTLRIDGLIEQVDLGQLATPVTAEAILNRIKELNPDIDLSQINITDINEENSEKSAVVNVNANSTLYVPGRILVRFQ